MSIVCSQNRCEPEHVLTSLCKHPTSTTLRWLLNLKGWILYFRLKHSCKYCCYYSHYTQYLFRFPSLPILIFLMLLEYKIFYIIYIIDFVFFLSKAPEIRMWVGSGFLVVILFLFISSFFLPLSFFPLILRTLVTCLLHSFLDHNSTSSPHILIFPFWRICDPSSMHWLISTFWNCALGVQLHRFSAFWLKSQVWDFIFWWMILCRFFSHLALGCELPIWIVTWTSSLTPWPF